IRSTWDYQAQVQAYLRALEAIDRSSARLENNFELVRWNIDKSYLKDLEQKGIKIVPTLWEKNLGQKKILSFFKKLETSRLVIKPTISAGAHHTFQVSADDHEIMSRIETVSRNRAFMIQPFMNNITLEGEFSVLYFGGEYSHTILKKPKTDDFRVQEEYGGVNRLVKPEQKLLSRTDQIMAALDISPLYARVDMVRQKDDFYLMELELIEPALYLNLDSESPDRFAAAWGRWMK
ncbi:MAG: hypothetical protein KJ668_22365, partial [Proteobacteria bacterium]|nr:hypothetical protein [Pseudomonadota bacterium]